ncbi:MAG: hypothetical protein LPK03_01225 [Pontibacter sp.]|nr:hypothetical protein [Pontibacter sp.]
MNKILLVLFCAVLFACNSISIEEPLLDSYMLMSDSEYDNDIAIVYDLGNGNYIEIISPSVVAVGFSKEFIIAKQHPKEFAKTADKSKTNYYIIPLLEKVNLSPDLNKVGPLTEIEFKKMRKEMGVPHSLDFKKGFNIH